LKKAIIFDLDGTLYDTEGLDEENETAAIQSLVEFKRIEPADAKSLLDKSRNSTTGKISLSKSLYLLGVPDPVFKSHQLRLLNPERHIFQDEELVSVIRSLKNDFSISIYTNSRREIVPRILMAIGFSVDDFDQIVAGGDVGEPKPSATEMAKVVRNLGLNPEDCYMVGDRWQVDLAPAEDVGLKTVQVNSRNQLVNWLESFRKN
jgi:FMN phosphatase YigB (HAD superfamily)